MHDVLLPSSTVPVREEDIPPEPVQPEAALVISQREGLASDLLKDLHQNDKEMRIAHI